MERTSSIFAMIPRTPTVRRMTISAALVPDAKGGLWIGVHGKGMDYFDGRHFTHFPPDLANPADLPEAWALPLLLDRHGMLWMARTVRDWCGSIRIRGGSKPIPRSQPGRPPDRELDKDVYSDGASIWVASPPAGCSVSIRRPSKFTHHYTEKRWLGEQYRFGGPGRCAGQRVGQHGKGLSRFDPRTEIFRNYDIFDGLQSNEFSSHCHAKAPDGRLFFGGVQRAKCLLSQQAC